MPKKKVEVYDKKQLIYPFIENDHVTFSNGMKVSEMLDQGISMPTITHNETSFKVGVGDSDVSSSVVDSSVSKMVIKGQTYQNILPEPSTHVLTNNKEIFKVNEGLDPNVEIVDGVSKSAILKGQTLVNVLSYVRRSGGAIYTKTDDLITVNSNGENTWSAVDLPLTQVKKNTKYIVMWDSVTISKEDYSPTGSLICIRKISDNVQISSAWVKEKNYVVATTTDDTNIVLRIHATQGTPMSNITTVKGLKVLEYQEGMENWDIPYFEGMQSVKMPVLTTYTNLFTGFITKGYIQNGEHLGATTDPNLLSDYIEIFAEHLAFRRFKKDGTPVNSFGEFAFYDADKNFIDRRINKQNVDESVTVPENTKYIRIWSRPTDDGIDEIAMLIYSKEKPSTITEYQPCKTNILRTPEEVVLRSVENAQDTINLNTGEYIQRIGEAILNGSESWQVLDNNTENTIGFTLRKVLPLRKTGDKYVKVNCDKLPSYKENLWNNDKIGCVAENNINQDLNDTQLQVRVLKSALSTQDTNGFKSWLQTNPLTIQYILETPIVKTVDLSSSGNWEKVVLDGNGTYVRNGSVSNDRISVFHYRLLNGLDDGSHVSFICDGLKIENSNNPYTIYKYTNTTELVLQFPTQVVSTLEQLKAHLSQNPITVWYQTATHQDSTNVKQPIFFKDGHITQSNGADNSLIPTLDYQAKTLNSYVMDLMKTNTKYTMKAKTASGTFTIDGTSYGAGTNGIFTTPTSMTNKFLVMSNKTNEEVMIIEGDVVSKDIPYFKGIKSAFEDESKIEVLSTGKNLFDGAFEKGMIDVNGNLGYTPTAIRTVNYISVKPNTSYYINLLNLEPFESFKVIYVHEYDESFKVLGEMQVDNRNIYTSKSATKFIKINTHTAHDLPVDSKMIVCENSTLDKQYEPYKSNNTKIPLLSPLRSLPNGVYDELIIDRMKNKSTLIQRVGCVMLDGSEEWGAYPTMEQDKTLLFQSKADCKQGKSAHCVSDRFPYSGSLWNSRFDDEGVMMGGGGSTYKRVDLRISKIKVSSTSPTILREYLSKNPFVVLYELETPIITEVDLDGFPYIYKDGHIFLNGEIAPTTEITYSINQCQQISASNEDIIRHEKELTYLQKLIAQYVQVDYESVLFSLKV